VKSLTFIANVRSQANYPSVLNFTIPYCSWY